MAEEVRAARLRRRQARRRRIVAAGAGVVLVGAGGAVALAAANGNGAGKRYATVRRADVTQVVESSGTVTSSAKATPAFPVTGTVRSVEVAVGDSVTKGQALARLDTTSLQDAVDSARSTLADARQKLEADRTGQTSSVTGGTSAAGGGLSTNTARYTALTTTAPAVGSSSGDQPTLLEQIQAAQQAVIAAQHAVDAAQAAIGAAQATVAADVVQNTELRDAQQTACAGSADGSGGPSPDACTSARADYETFADTLAADSAALGEKVGAQDGDVTQLNVAVAKLDQLLGQLSSAGAGGGSTGTGTGGSDTGGSGTGGSGTGGSGTGGSGSRGGGGTGGTSNRPTGGSGTTTARSGGSSTTPSSGQSSTEPASAAQLAADQASIDAAAAAVRAAGQDLAATTLHSPIAGKVAAVGLVNGQSSSGGSITIVGTGVQKVTTSVPLAQIGLLEVGQPVSVAADGVAAQLHGIVQSIGMLSSTSGSTTTFPVTVQLGADSPKLYDGAGADVRITTGTARSVVAVPNSAIHSGFRGTHTVTVVRDGKDTSVQVTLGVAGSALTQVKRGLHVGDRVVLADFSTSVPASTNSTTGSYRLSRLLGGGGGGGGGGAVPVLRGGR